MDVTGYPYDLVPLLSVEAGPHSAAERVACGPPPLGERAADHHSPTPGGVVIPLKGTARHDRNAHRFEVTGRRPTDMRHDRQIVRAARMILHLHVEERATAQRQSVHQAHRLHARQSRHAVDELAVEFAGCTRVGNFTGRDREPHRQHTIRVEACVHRAKRQHAADHQPGADEQDERERHLRHDER